METGSGGQVWVWGYDNNEKMTGPSRREGDSGGGSHGEEGAHRQEGLLGELDTWTGTHRHAERGNGLGKGLRKGRGEGRPGAVHLFAQTRSLGV